MRGCSFESVGLSSTLRLVDPVCFSNNHSKALQVTLGMCLVGALTWMRGLLVFFAQIVGAIIAAAITSCLFPGELNVQTTLGPGTSITQGLFIEMFLAAELIFTIFMLAAEKHRGTYLAPLGVGLSVFIIELTGKTARSRIVVVK